MGGRWQLLVLALLPFCFVTFLNLTFPKPLEFPGPQLPPLQNGECTSSKTPVHRVMCQVAVDYSCRALAVLTLP